MIKLLKDLFSENGNTSLMRLMSLMVCCTGCFLALVKGPEELGVITVLLTTAFTGKVLQKRIEVGSGNKDVN